MSALEPYYSTPDGRAKLYLGDARQLPAKDESVDMIATSPPYWGKRDYGEDVVAIWGGEPECDHSWDISVRRQGDKSGPHGPASDIGAKAAQDAVRRGEPSAYCSLCGAWRGQLGLEPTWGEYIAHLCECAEEWWRVLKPTGNLFVNMGDTFASKPPGSKPSWSTSGLHGAATSETYQGTLDASVMATADTTRGNIPKMKLGIPYRLRFALNDMGWVSRDDIIWYKGKRYPDGKITKVAMPESVKDRMSCSYEMLLHFVKEPKGYWFDLDAARRPAAGDWGPRDRSRMKLRDIDQYGQTALTNSNPHPGGSNPGDVWIIQPEPFKEAHYAVWPSKLCERMIKVGCPKEVCPKCGKPRERISESHTTYESHWGKQGLTPEDVRDRGKYGETDKALDGDRKRVKHDIRLGPTPHVITIGWSDCGCGEGFVPGVILDPFFGGSGRIAERALYLGRNFIGVDMKEEYLSMAKNRLLQGVLL